MIQKTFKPLPVEFYRRDVLLVAPDLLGKIIRLTTANGLKYFFITETEAYRGEEDKACHCHKGRTKRTEVMYRSGGVFYVYLIYGKYWMLNIVTGHKNEPQAVLIRAIKSINPETEAIQDCFDGPGKTGMILNVKKEFYGMPVNNNRYLAVLNINFPHIPQNIKKLPRIGIDYAGEFWKNKLWRFVLH